MTEDAISFDHLIEEVINFVEREIRPFQKITRHTNFSSDLVLLPEDADDLMKSFFTTFGVLVGDFDGNRYFPNQMSILPTLVGKLFSIFRPPFIKSADRQKNCVCLTIEMLAGAVCDGIWLTNALEKKFGS